MQVDYTIADRLITHLACNCSTTCLQHCRQVNSLWSNNLLATLQTDQFTLIKQLACNCSTDQFTLIKQLACNCSTDRSIQPTCNITCRLITQLQTDWLHILLATVRHLVCIEKIFFKVILFFIFPKKPSKNFSTGQSKMFRYFLKQWHENCIYFDILLVICMKVYRICIKHNISANE